MEQFIEDHKTDRADYTSSPSISPAYLSVLIHCHALCDALHDSTANKEAIEVFLQDGIIEPDASGFRGSGYHTTEKGRRWMEMILSTPYPEFRWVDPRK